MLRRLLIGIAAVTMGSGVVTLLGGIASAKKMESLEILFKDFKSVAATARSYNKKAKLCAGPRRQMCKPAFTKLSKANEAFEALNRHAKTAP